MGKFSYTIVILLFTACSAEKKAGEESSVPKEEIPSPRKEAQGEANGVHVTIDYGSPAVKGRKIWGGLENFERVWRAGANETTAVTFDRSAKINGEPIEEGKYAFFIIPKEKENWVVIFNRDWDEWGAFSYNQEHDVLRVSVKPEWTEENQERLEYYVADGTLNLRWEKVKISMEIEASE